jgi:murein DD-endopeptidase MepM/ murein hydrolase activator NlpD
VLAFLLVLALAHARPLAASPSPIWSSWPAQGTVTTPFSSFHPGIDIGILRALEVRAAQPGVVIAVGRLRGFEGYGNVVQIADGGGFTSLYAHLTGWRVRVDEQVQRGQRIGTAGCTGWCTGTHLHFEMRLRGRPVNPLSFRRPLTRWDRPDKEAIPALWRVHRHRAA